MRPVKPLESERAKRALDWNKGFGTPTVRDGKTDFEVELDYANQRYQESIANFVQVDSKLEALLRFSGTFSAAVIGFTRIANLTVDFYLYICVGTIMLALAFCLWGRICLHKASPVDISQILDYSNDAYPPSTVQVRAALAASMHTTVETVEAAVEWKAGQFARATLLAAFGVIGTVIWLCCQQ